jgi:hypothetical protein
VWKPTTVENLSELFSSSLRKSTARQLAVKDKGFAARFTSFRVLLDSSAARAVWKSYDDETKKYEG